MQERVEERMAGCTQLQVQALQCGDCGALSERPQARCAGHAVCVVTATKRFFRCAPRLCFAVHSAPLQCLRPVRFGVHTAAVVLPLQRRPLLPLHVRQCPCQCLRPAAS
jgi:hypothetical protein